MVILIEMMLEVLIGVLVMEVDKVADEVTNMEVDKVTNMMAEFATNTSYLVQCVYGNVSNFHFPPLFYDNQRMVLGLDWRARVVESLLITSAGTEVTLFGKQTLNISSQNISSQDREY